MNTFLKILSATFKNLLSQPLTTNSIPEESLSKDPSKTVSVSLEPTRLAYVLGVTCVFATGEKKDFQCHQIDLCRFILNIDELQSWMS